MKSKLLLSLLTIFLVPAQLGATVVQAEVWQRPNGTRIVILGDNLEECPAEKQQIIDCTIYLKSLTKPYFLKVKNLSSEFASKISNAGIPHDDLTFVPDDLDSCTINITPLAKKFLADAQQETMSAKLKDDYNTLLASFEAHVKTLRPIESLPYGPDDCCTECNPDLCLSLTLDQMFDIAQSIFDYILASRLENKAANESCVLIESSMMNALAHPLQKLGYTRTATFGTFTPEAAETMFMEKWDALQAQYAQNGTCSCSSDEDDGGELATSIMNEVMNHFALNLKEIFKQCKPSASMHHMLYFQQKAREQERLNRFTHNTMTPTEYRAWSAGYDNDMRNENLPISGYGSN